MSCLGTVFHSIKQGLEYILLFKGGIVYLFYFYSRIEAKDSFSLVPNDILMFVGLLGFIAYFINPLELRKRKGEKSSVSNSYSGMVQLYLMFGIMTAQYYSQDKFIEIYTGSFFKTSYFWVCLSLCLILLYFVQVKLDKNDYSSYDKYKKDPNFNKILLLSFIPFVFTAVMISYISAYCINYKWNSSLPDKKQYEIEKIYEVKSNGEVAEVSIHYADIKTDYSNLKKIALTIDEYKKYKAGDYIVFSFFKGYLGVPYIDINKSFISAIEK